MATAGVSPTNGYQRFRVLDVSLFHPRDILACSSLSLLVPALSMRKICLNNRLHSAVTSQVALKTIIAVGIFSMPGI